MVDNKKIIFLSTFLHSGLDWVHSLLDSHSEILIMPALSFYRCWTRFNFSEVECSEKVYTHFFKYINDNIGPNSLNEQKKFLNSQEELDNFFYKLRELLCYQKSRRRDVFLYIHESYAFAKNINLEKIKIIISHETLPFYKKYMKIDFIESRLILVLRDPRAALAGIWHRRISQFDYLPDYTFNMSIDCWLYGINIVKDNFYQINKNLYIIQNEKVHENLNLEMRKLCRWLCIEFQHTLLSESYPSGKNVFVDSAYLLNNKLNDQNLFNQEIPKDYFRIENVKKRWRKVLSKSQIIMIENILSYCFDKFGYKKLFSNNIFNKFYSLIIFIVPQKNLFIRWIKHYPNIDVFQRITDRLDKDNNNYIKRLWLVSPKIS